jgi:hypothetical protein
MQSATRLDPLSWHHLLKVLPYGIVVFYGSDMICHVNGRVEVTGCGVSGLVDLTESRRS